MLKDNIKLFRVGFLMNRWLKVRSLKGGSPGIVSLNARASKLYNTDYPL